MLMCGIDGRISAWDLLRRQHEPVLTMQLPDPLLRQSFHDQVSLYVFVTFWLRNSNISLILCVIQGSIVTVGSRKGNIFLVELSLTLAQSEKNDKGMLTAVSILLF